MRNAIYAALIVFAACRGETEDRGKVRPNPPPVPRTALPVGISIEVNVNGQPSARLTNTPLRQTPPFFERDGRRAWRVRDLIRAAKAGTTITLHGAYAVQMQLVVPTDPTGLEPSLLISKRGDVSGVALDPADPFPDYHGRGRRLGRRGSEHPRVDNVRRITVSGP